MQLPPVGQTLAHAPQLSAEDRTLTQMPPHMRLLSGQRQEPLMHCSPAAESQTVPQAPQLLVSYRRSVHVPEQLT